ncbi:13811_t:CDS:2, partial [Racocetra persica]
GQKNEKKCHNIPLPTLRNRKNLIEYTFHPYGSHFTSFCPVRESTISIVLVCNPTSLLLAIFQPERQLNCQNELRLESSRVFLFNDSQKPRVETSGSLPITPSK